MLFSQGWLSDARGQLLAVSLLGPSEASSPKSSGSTFELRVLYAQAKSQSNLEGRNAGADIYASSPDSVFYLESYTNTLHSIHATVRPCN